VPASQQLASVGQRVAERTLDAGAFAPLPRLSVLAEATAEVAVNAAALHTQYLCASGRAQHRNRHRRPATWSVRGC